MLETQKSDHFEKVRRVLVPVDLSPLSYQALDVAADLARENSKIRIFHAVHPVYTNVTNSTEGITVPVYDASLSAAEIDGAKKILNEKAADITGDVDVEVVEAGKVVADIAEAAERFQAELVVMTTHGRGGLTRLLAGSVAEELFHLFPGAILLLRPKRKDAQA